MELYEEISIKNSHLDMAIRTLRQNGSAYAQAEMDYKIKLREEVLKLRDSGVAVGIIDKIAYGIPSVAELRFKRDIAKATYEANQEAINSIKLQIRILDSQLDREWSSTK